MSAQDELRSHTVLGPNIHPRVGNGEIGSPNSWQHTITKLNTTGESPDGLDRTILTAPMESKENGPAVFSGNDSLNNAKSENVVTHVSSERTTGPQTILQKNDPSVNKSSLAPSLLEELSNGEGLNGNAADIPYLVSAGGSSVSASRSARLSDLCEEDKAKVARLIQRLMKVCSLVSSAFVLVAPG
jgi:hypothetical protein